MSNTVNQLDVAVAAQNAKKVTLYTPAGAIPSRRCPKCKSLGFTNANTNISIRPAARKAGHKMHARRWVVPLAFRGAACAWDCALFMNVGYL